MSETYICSVCKKYKTASEFPKCSRNKYRNCLNCTCKKCFKDIYGKNRRQVIDKIDPNKGYEVGNVQFVCFAANMMKGELSLSELKKFCQAIIKNNNYA